jgi:hypothetical protein
MPITELKCPQKTYRNALVQVNAETELADVTRVEFTWSGAISHYEARMGYAGWGSFTSQAFAGNAAGRVDVRAAFYDAAGNLRDVRHGWFEVL